MSLLTIVQAAALRFGLGLPGIAASSTDQNVQQLVAFANEEGQELGKYAWQALLRESTWNTTATEDQGSILTLAGTDFGFVYNETLWNRTQRRPVFGPKSPAEWQQIKAQFMQGPWNQYRIRGNRMLFTPIPAAGQAIYFEWVTRNWATTGDGITGKSLMTADTDVALLDEQLITLGTVWRFKAAKGLDFATDLEKYEGAVADAKARDGSKPRLNLQGQQTDVWPAVVVPAGNWGLP